MRRLAAERRLAWEGAPFVLGLTGSIAMGKSTAAGMLRRMGLPLHDSDAAVHRLLGPKGAAVTRVARSFVGVLDEAKGAIDRPALGRAVFGDAAALARLEAILHPLVRAEAAAFVKQARAARKRIVVLDIPLLFETGAERRCHGVVVVSAPAFLQRQRVLARPGMTEARLEAILSRQLADSEKRRRADWVVPSSLGRGVTWQALASLVADIRG